MAHTYFVDISNIYASMKQVSLGCNGSLANTVFNVTAV